MNGTDVQLALRRWRNMIGSPIFLGIVAAATLISVVNSISLQSSLAVAAKDLAWHLVISVVSSSVASLVILIAVAVLKSRVAIVPRYGLAGIVATPFVFIAVTGLFALADQAIPETSTLISMFVNVAVTVIAISLVIGLVVRAKTKPISEEEITSPTVVPEQSAVFSNCNMAEVPEEVSGQAEFLRRLPENLGRDLMRLSASDHYVEAYTKAGQAMILLRFSDALKELSGMDGLQIHRSHWVARNAVQYLISEGRSLSVQLYDGTRLPVSRSRFSAVRAEGFSVQKVN